jgi:ribosomal protein S4
MQHFVGALSKKLNINKNFYQKKYYSIVKNRQSTSNNLSYLNKMREERDPLSLIIEKAMENQVFQIYQQMSYIKNNKFGLKTKFLLTLQL